MIAALEPLAHVKTKIVATVGPASDSAERLDQLVRAGVDIFRLNMAHGTLEWRNAVLQRIREVGQRLTRMIAVLADLGGPKIRLGPLPGGLLECGAGTEFKFVTNPITAGDPHELTATYPNLVSELKVEDLVLLADGTVSMRVVEK